MDIDASSEFAPALVTHPFFESAFVVDRNTNELVNILEDKDAYERAIEDVTKQIKEVKKYYEFEMLIRKQYRLVFLKFTKEYVSKEDFSNFLIESWIDDEYANRNINVPPTEIIKYFKMADRKTLMNKKEYEIYSMLENTVTVYRGVTDYNKDCDDALSWTLDKSKAEFFATRFSQQGYIYQAKINKDDVLCYCDRRNEKEVILDYRKLYGLEMLEELNKNFNDIDNDEPDICED